MIEQPDSPLVSALASAVNFEPRRGVEGPDILLLHYTGMSSAKGALDWLRCAESGVSCHYFVHEDGEILQLVAERERAYHAGAGSWEGRGDVNSRSIGIEIVNAGHDGGLPPFPDVQMEAVAALSRDIIARHTIQPWHVLGHSDTAPGRKIDPGERFDWAWLARQGVGLWPEPVSGEAEVASIAEVQQLLAAYGYGIPTSGDFDSATVTIIEAFQRHFRSGRIDGRIDAETSRLLRAAVAAKQQPSS